MRLDLASYSTSVVQTYKQVLLKEWRSGRLEDMDDAIQLELERIDDTVRELWGQWERSKEAQTEVHMSKRGRPAGTGANGSGGGLQTVEATETEKTKAGLGDVSYIAEIRKQLMERRKLLGLYAPEKKDISGGMSFASFLMESGKLDEAERMSYEEADSDNGAGDAATKAGRRPRCVVACRLV